MEKKEKSEEMKLRCLIFGHQWWTYNYIQVCQRCKKREQLESQDSYKPVSELDAIIHDENWYRPKQKEINK